MECDLHIQIRTDLGLIWVLKYVSENLSVMSKNNIKHENVFAVFVIPAMLAMGAISAIAILPNGLLYAQEEDAQEFTAENDLEKQKYHLLRHKFLEMQLLSSNSQATK